MVFNATFKNISVMSWSVLLVEEIRVPKENHRPAASHWQTLSYSVVSSTPRYEQDLNFSDDRNWLHKSNYHTITTRMAPLSNSHNEKQNISHPRNNSKIYFK